MPVSHPLYRELFHFICDLLPQLPHPVRKRLMWLVFGIVITKSLVLSRIAAEHAAFCPDSTAEESHERRLRRIENDPHLTWRDTYAPAVRRIVTGRRVANCSRSRVGAPPAWSPSGITSIKNRC